MFVNYILVMVSYMLPYLLVGDIIGKKECDLLIEECDEEREELEQTTPVVLIIQFCLIVAILTYELAFCFVINKKMKFTGSNSYIVIRALSATVGRLIT
jgi:hypothetical protein